MDKKIKLFDKEFELYIPEKQLIQRVEEIAIQINKDFENKKPVFISVLNGSFFFTADLARHISLPCEISFVKLASYEGTKSGGEIKNLIGLNENLEGKDVIIVEDIIDSGRTMQHLLHYLKQLNPACIKIAALLLKKPALKVDIFADYIGFEVPDKFLVGYGLDYNKLGRNLSDIFSMVEYPTNFS